jgi:carboxyl-terminal processing protease
MKTPSFVRMAALLLSTVAFSYGQQDPTPGKYQPDGRQIMITVARLLEQGHYTRRKLDEEMSGRILDTYLQALDSTKLFFIQDDIDQIHKKYQTTLGHEILDGDLAPAKEIYSIFRQRMEDRVAKIQVFLKKDFSFRSNRTVAMDRHKEPWPSSLAEADNLWRDRIEGELLQEKLNPMSTDPGVKVVGKRYDQLLKDARERDDSDLLQIFLDATAQTYDPHSEFLGPTELDRFETRMRLSYPGIGAELRSEGGYTKVTRLLPGGPAEATGKLQVGDRITAVAEGDNPFVDAIDLKLQKVIDLIRGKQGTVVRLQVLPVHSADPSKRRIVEMIRDTVKLTDQEAHAEVIHHQRMDGSIESLGWITLPSFYQDMSGGPGGKSTSKDVSALLKRLKKEQIQGLVIDLRNDGGGSLDEAIKMTGLFVTQGPVVQVKDANGAINVLKDAIPGTEYDGPLIVLVNKLSASASEIFAAALQDYGRAAIVGDSGTFGKGTVQAMYDLGRFMPNLSRDSDPNVGALKPTIQKFYRVAGGSTQLRGVSSDVKLPAVTDNPDFGEASLDHPLPYDEVEPVPIRIEENRHPLFCDELRQRSAARISQDPEFRDIAEQIRQTSEITRSNRLSLNEASRRAQIEAEEKLKQKELTDGKFDEQNSRYIRFQLKLADIDKPELNPVESTNMAQSATPTPLHRKLAGKSQLDEAISQIGSPDSAPPSSEAIRREALNIVSDLIELNNSPQISDSERAKAANMH